VSVSAVFARRCCRAAGEWGYGLLTPVDSYGFRRHREALSLRQRSSHFFALGEIQHWLHPLVGGEPRLSEPVRFALRHAKLGRVICKPRDHRLDLARIPGLRQITDHAAISDRNPRSPFHRIRRTPCQHRQHNPGIGSRAGHSARQPGQVCAHAVWDLCQHRRQPGQRLVHVARARAPRGAAISPRASPNRLLSRLLAASTSSSQLSLNSRPATIW